MGLTLPFTEEKKTFQFTPKERKMSQRSWAWLGNFSKGLCICIYIYLGMNSCCVRPWKAAHFLFFQRLLIKHSLQPNFNTSEVGLTVNRYLTEKARNLHFCFRVSESQISNLNANLGKPCLWKPGRQWMFCQSWKHAPLLAWLSLLPPPAQPGLKQLIDVNRCNSCDFASFYASNLVNHIRVSQLSNMKLVAYSFEQSTRSPCSPLSF